MPDDSGPAHDTSDRSRQSLRWSALQRRTPIECGHRRTFPKPNTTLRPQNIRKMRADLPQNNQAPWQARHPSGSRCRQSTCGGGSPPSGSDSTFCSNTTVPNLVDNAHRRLLHRNIQSCKMRHRRCSFPRCRRSGATSPASYVKGCNPRSHDTATAMHHLSASRANCLNDANRAQSGRCTSAQVPGPFRNLSHN